MKGDILDEAEITMQDQRQKDAQGKAEASGGHSDGPKG